MERVKFQGIRQIVRFNWHLYAGAVGAVLILLLFHWWWAAWLVVAPTLVSLLVSLYVYDLSGLYGLEWLPGVERGCIVNIHAGFDETSGLLARKYAGCEVVVCDFYNRSKHTELSIAQARKAFPPYPGTQRIGSGQVPLAMDSADMIYLIFAAHEIRADEERERFFRELCRVAKPGGRIVVVEHLRDWRNFLAYTAGCGHFLPAAVWKRTFGAAALKILEEKWVNAFVRMYVLGRDEAGCVAVG